MQSLYDATGSWPALNQLELHILCKRNDIVAFCRERSIVVLGYGIFGSREAALLEKPELISIAKEIGCSVGNVVLAWAKQKEIVVVFGSTSESHIRENLKEQDVVLTESHVALLDSMEDRYGTHVMGWKGVVDLDSVDL